MARQEPPPWRPSASSERREQPQQLHRVRQGTVDRTETRGCKHFGSQAALTSLAVRPLVGCLFFFSLFLVSDMMWRMQVETMQTSTTETARDRESKWSPCCRSLGRARTGASHPSSRKHPAMRTVKNKIRKLKIASGCPAAAPHARSAHSALRAEPARRLHLL